MDLRRDHAATEPGPTGRGDRGAPRSTTRPDAGRGCACRGHACRRGARRGRAGGGRGTRWRGRGRRSGRTRVPAATVLDRLSRTGPRRPVHATANRDDMAAGRTAAAVEAADRHRLRVVRRCQRARFHDRTARVGGTRRRVRRAHGARAVDARLGPQFRRQPWRTARDTRLARRHRLRAGGHGRTARARRSRRPPDLARRHPRRRRRGQPRLGHGGVAPRSRRHHRRAPGRIERQIGGGLRSPRRPDRLVGARRQGLVLVAGARDDSRRPSDRGPHGVTRRRHHAGSRRAAVGVSVAVWPESSTATGRGRSRLRLDQLRRGGP